MSLKRHVTFVIKTTICLNVYYTAKNVVYSVAGAIIEKHDHGMGERCYLRYHPLNYGILSQICYI